MSYTPDLLIDGYISRSFRPNRDAENYLCYLLKTNQAGLRQSYQTLPAPNSSGVVWAARATPGTFAPRPLAQDPNGYQLWLLDYSITNIGTVVPQSLWSPKNVNDLKHYVAEATLELPIFFSQEDGNLGLSLSDAARGHCQTLRDARMHAHLGGKHTTNIRIMWPGYIGYKRQIQIRDDTVDKNPVTIAKFAQHVGRSVEAFLNVRKLDETRREGDDNLKWIIGQDGIDESNIRIIGAIHVSAGNWMPILQLNSWVY